MHVASSRGNVECVRALLDGGASGSAALDLQDRRGSTPLHLALRRGHVHVAMLLLHAGADFDIQVGMIVGYQENLTRISNYFTL